ncbi:MAG: histone deacetylase [Verrucomicrobia bacterium]|nr:histone deacetylase [Verrucomicrobiota bacterium]
MKAFYHPGYASPIGSHIMPMSKFGLLAEKLKAIPEVVLAEPQPLTEVEIRRVHSEKYLQAIQTGSPQDLAESQKFPWSPQLYPSVCLTGGGCLAASRQALRDKVSAALVSGFHHSTANYGGGFCTFNSLVVTLDTLVAHGEIRTGAVLDLDLHYGNGTARLIAQRPPLLALSIYGVDYPDHPDFREEKIWIHQDGENHQSRALPAMCDRHTLLATLDDELPKIAARRPDILLYQAGADPYFEDPYSPLNLNHDDLFERDRRVFEFTRAEKIPVAWVLAGGYTHDVSKVVQVHFVTNSPP